MKKLIILTLLLFGFTLTSYAQCVSGYGMASTRVKKNDYCRYLYVKVTNTSTKKQKIVIEIKKDDGRWQSQGAKTVNPGAYFEVYTCTERNNYRWAVVNTDCYNYSNFWKYGN